MFLVCYGLYIDVSNVSMGFSVIFCVYEHIYNLFFIIFLNLVEKHICGASGVLN